MIHRLMQTDRTIQKKIGFYLYIVYACSEKYIARNKLHAGLINVDLKIVWYVEKSKQILKGQLQIRRKNDLKFQEPSISNPNNPLYIELLKE